MGAALRRSPVPEALDPRESRTRSHSALQRLPDLGVAVDNTPFAFPQVRDWLSFTAERAFVHSMAMIVGVAGRDSEGTAAPWVRPLKKEPRLWGHLHAAAFSYQPLPRGEVELRAAVTSLFEQQTLQGILHLLADQREGVGLGESQLVRGGCWFSPIGDVIENRS
jgi:hypothetical protein